MRPSSQPVPPADCTSEVFYANAHRRAEPVRGGERRCPRSPRKRCGSAERSRLAAKLGSAGEASCPDLSMKMDEILGQAAWDCPLARRGGMAPPAAALPARPGASLNNFPRVAGLLSGRSTPKSCTATLLFRPRSFSGRHDADVDFVTTHILLR